MISALVNRPAIGNFPCATWYDHLTNGLLRVAPKGLDHIFTAQSGSEANELAYKASFMLYRRKERGEGVEWTTEEIESCLNNSAPGSPDLAVMSFTNSFHGRGFGSLSTTRSKAVHKLDIPSFNWPQAPFPKLQYPEEKFAAENAAEEKRCLEEVERLIKSWHCPVAALIVEPIQSEGGDNHASPAFFQGLRDITKKHGVVLIADEVQTGMFAVTKRETGAKKLIGRFVKALELPAASGDTSTGTSALLRTLSHSLRRRRRLGTSLAIACLSPTRRTVNSTRLSPSSSHV
jgi:4-aminobutyrate aminotransferase/(S)-3-amino-2-methylpropionate transaminase